LNFISLSILKGQIKKVFLAHFEHSDTGTFLLPTNMCCSGMAKKCQEQNFLTFNFLTNKVDFEFGHSECILQVSMKSIEKSGPWHYWVAVIVNFKRMQLNC
jgi:hypothetical protein